MKGILIFIICGLISVACGEFFDNVISPPFSYFVYFLLIVLIFVSIFEYIISSKKDK